MLRHLIAFTFALIFVQQAMAQTPVAFIRADAAVKYRDWEKRFEQDLKNYAKALQTSEKLKDSEIERIFASSITPNSC